MEITTIFPTGYLAQETADGSVTLFSKSFGEAFHSKNGAIKETLLHYIEGCKIKEKCENKSPFNILEVGFGMGIGFLTTLSELKNQHFHFYSLELDENLLEWFRVAHQNHPFLKNLSWKGNILSAKNEFISLTILQGDARKTLPEFLETHALKWDAIYQDAFSPKRSPTLWTTEWFTFLKEHSDPEVILSTYSASETIQKSLVAAGFHLKKGPAFGAKKSSTRAVLKGETDLDLQNILERSPIEALSDSNIQEFLSK